LEGFYYMSLNVHNSEPLLKTEKIESTVVLTLNRPKAGNSISYELALELEKTFMDLGEDKSVSSIIITGEGDKFFCTGGDVKKYASFKTKEELQHVFDKICDVLDLIESVDIPVLAAINGYALGGGLELALASDIRVMSAKAEVGFPQSQIGVIPGWNGIERILSVLGRGSSMKLLLTGDRINASEAYRIGLVDEIAEEQSALHSALALAKRIQTAAPMSVRSIKKVVRENFQASRQEARDIARSEFARLWFTNDHKEAEAAFAQKRKAVFTNS